MVIWMITFFIVRRMVQRSHNFTVPQSDNVFVKVEVEEVSAVDLLTYVSPSLVRKSARPPKAQQFFGDFAVDRRQKVQRKIAAKRPDITPKKKRSSAVKQAGNLKKASAQSAKVKGSAACDPSRLFKCELCPYAATFSTKFALFVHRQRLHEIGDVVAITCAVCSRRFASMATLKKHHALVHRDAGEEKKEQEDGGRHFRCHVCDFATKSSHYLKLHISSIHSGNTVYRCEKCPGVFRRRDVLYRHVINVHNLGSTAASEATTSKDTSNAFPFVCSSCGMRCMTKAILAKHIQKIHTKLRPFSCAVCGNTFTTSTHLKRHSFIHSRHQLWDFACAQCSFSTHRKDRLVEHLFKHSGFDRSHPELMPFPCTICQHGFRAQLVLQAHLQRQHKPGRQNVCRTCNVAFRSLKDHVSNVHTNNDAPGKHYKCSYCLLPFGFAQGLIAHLSYHCNRMPFACSLCQGGFRSQHDLLDHTQAKHAGKLPKCHWCTVCLEIFTSHCELRNHNLVHW